MLAPSKADITISFALLDQSFFRSIPKPIFEYDLFLLFLLSTRERISLSGIFPMPFSLLNLTEGGILNEMSIIFCYKMGEMPVTPKELKNLSLVGTKS